jgi:hypothetical protein
VGMAAGHRITGSLRSPVIPFHNAHGVAICRTNRVGRVLASAGSAK